MQFLKGCALFCLCVALLSLADLFQRSAKSEEAIAGAVEAVPMIVRARLAKMQDQVLRLVDQHAKRIETTLDTTVKIADARLGSIQAAAVTQLAEANLSISTVAGAAAASLPQVSTSITNSVASLAADVHQVATPAAAIAKQTDDALPMFLDCEYNPDCVFNRFQGTSKAIERSAQAFAKAAPSMADSAAKIEGHVDNISASVDKEVAELTKPKHWWQHALDFLKIGAMGAARLI